MVRFTVPGLMGRANRLTSYSIREALRTYLPPIKSDDPQIDFYTMYKRETMEYDTEYMKKYDEDLNTTLIFVRCHHFPSHHTELTTPTGWSIFCSQLRLCH